MRVKSHRNMLIMMTIVRRLSEGKGIIRMQERTDDNEGRDRIKK